MSTKPRCSAGRARSLGSQDDHRIDARRPARREIAGRQRRDDQQRGGRDERNGIALGDAEQQRREQARGGQRSRESGDDPGDRERAARRSPDGGRPALRAERQADAELSERWLTSNDTMPYKPMQDSASARTLKALESIASSCSRTSVVAICCSIVRM